MVHTIKIQLEYANRILDEAKKFEVRKNDRDYQVGDLLRFKVIDTKYACPREEVDHELNNQAYRITYIHTGLGMQPGYVILGIDIKE